MILKFFCFELLFLPRLTFYLGLNFYFLSLPYNWTRFIKDFPSVDLTEAPRFRFFPLSTAAGEFIGVFLSESGVRTLEIQNILCYSALIL